MTIIGRSALVDIIKAKSIKEKLFETEYLEQTEARAFGLHVHAPITQKLLRCLL